METSTLKSFKNAQFLAMLTGLLLFTSITAQAAMFSFVGGASSDFPTGWNPSNAPELDQSMDVTVFNQSNGGGVRLDQAADLVYTYIGKEAGSTNAFIASNHFFLTDTFFSLPGTDHNSTFEILGADPGFLDFSFIGLGTCCVAPVAPAVLQ